jgi:glycosyltransferase involved in cell wall biosynthesis
VQILFLSPCAQLGGAERCLLDMLASLRQAQPHWTLHLIAGEDGPLLSQARGLGVTSECLPFPRPLAQLGSFQTPLQIALACLRVIPALALYCVRLRRAIDKIAPAIVHSNGVKMHLLAAWNAGRVPVIWHLHDYLSTHRVSGRALQFSALRCAGAIAISQSVAADAKQMLGTRAIVKTILNAVDLQRFCSPGPQFDLGPLASSTVRVGLIATFARWKGHEIFLHALASPQVRCLDMHAYVIGGPIYQTSNSQRSLAELTLLADRLGLRNRITFTGFIPDTPAVMRALDIVVHASTEPEPFGLVIAEAMACGRPVIASQSGGATEVLWADRTGIGVPPGDVDALAAALVRLTRDGFARFYMGRAGRVVAEARFDRNRLGPALCSFYKEVLNACEFSTSTAAISTAA